MEGGKKPVVLTDEGKRFVEKFLSEYRDRVITSPPPYKGDDSDDIEDLTEEEAREVKKLISEGMARAFARAAVLGEKA